MKVSIYKKHAFVISLALLVTVLAFMGIVHWAVLGYYEQKVRMGDAQLTHVLARHVERSLRAEDEVISMLADYPDLYHLSKPEQQFVLLKTVRDHPHYELLAIVNMEGDQIARSWGENGARGDREWFLQFQKTGHGAVSDVYTSRSTGNSIVTITKGLYDASGNAEGLIMADIRTTDLRNLIASMNSDPDCDIYLLDGSGNTIAAPDGKDATTIDATLAEAVAGHTFWRDDAGRRVIGVYQTIDSFLSP